MRHYSRCGRIFLRVSGYSSALGRCGIGRNRRIRTFHQYSNYDSYTKRHLWPFTIIHHYENRDLYTILPGGGTLALPDRTRLQRPPPSFRSPPLLFRPPALFFFARPQTPFTLRKNSQVYRPAGFSISRIQLLLCIAGSVETGGDGFRRPFPGDEQFHFVTGVMLLQQRRQAVIV